MFSRPKTWFSGGLAKPKKPHSLEHLKYLYNVLNKNQTITESNRSLLIEVLRSISEILIWGDQNDSSVFDFFLEKNMLSFFIRYLQQKCGQYICVQLLQTLNILFENISNETSLYYLLSNNMINSIIVHKFDFSDEEVMAYYISFLKTLSLKLNKHTIHFFYNEHTNDFALYTEAIKFFNHSETMVRIAVRTITLNVYKVDDKSMLRYIRDKTAVPYFSNLVWFIGNHILELDSCVRNDLDHQSRNKLSDLVAEHLDHLHYLNDILCLGINALNDVLTDHLLNRLLIPLYVYSLTKGRRPGSVMHTDRPHISSVVSLFLLSQVFLILTWSPLVRELSSIIFNADNQLMEESESEPGNGSHLRFVPPSEPLAQVLDSNRGRGKPMKRPNYRNSDEAGSPVNQEGNSTFYMQDEEYRISEGEGHSEHTSPVSGDTELSSPNQNSTDEEKLMSTSLTNAASDLLQPEFSLTNRPYLEALYNALDCRDGDYEALFTLCLLYAMGHNDGIPQSLLDSVGMPTDRSRRKCHHSDILIDKLIKIISMSTFYGSKIRLATLEMSILLLKQLVCSKDESYLQDRQLAMIEGAKEESLRLIRTFFKSEEIFLDMFEDEYREKTNRPLNVEYLTMDASILLPPTGTPLTGIDFNKRLPCGEVERARRAIRVYFLIRDLSQSLRQEEETQLPLTRYEQKNKDGDVLDLNNSDLIGCTVIGRENKKERRFMVIDVSQLILVEPDVKRLGWGVIRFVGSLQDIEITGDKECSRTLHVTIHKPSTPRYVKSTPILTARFIFDDHIRCMAAKQRLTKGRLRARQKKMQLIANLLEIPSGSSDGSYQASAGSFRSSSIPIPGSVQRVQYKSSSPVHRVQHNAIPQQVDRQPVEQTSHPKDGSVGSRYETRGRVESQSDFQSSVEIEEAVDATSPSAFAFQALNGGSVELQRQNSRSSGRHSRNSSDATSQIVENEEIPLEDLSASSKRARAMSAQTIDTAGKKFNKPENSAIKSTKHGHVRSSSLSPRRHRSSTSPTGRAKSATTEKVRSRSLSGGHADKNNSGSFVSSLKVSAAIAKVKGKSTKGSKITQTSFTQHPARPRSISKDSSDGSESGKTRARSVSRESDSGKKHVEQKLKNVKKSSDMSSKGSHHDHGKGNRQNEYETVKYKKQKSKHQGTNESNTTSTDLTTGDAGFENTEYSPTKETSASDQLTKLAKTVTEHYNSLDDDDKELTSTEEKLKPSASEINESETDQDEDKNVDGDGFKESNGGILEV